MGAWGTHIFDDDGAADIHAEYRILLGYRVEPNQAWHLIYNNFYQNFKESDDEDVFWLATSLFQWQNGILREDVKQKALQCIDDESYLEVWKESDPAVYKKRKAALEQLKDKLLHEVNPPKRVPKCPLYYREKTKFLIGDVFSFTHENGKISYVQVVQIRKTAVSKLVTELDYRSNSNFALLDVWSEKRYSLEELTGMPYRRFFEGTVQDPYSVRLFDTFSVYDENCIKENMEYHGNISFDKLKEQALYGEVIMQTFSRTYSKCIQSTFSLPYSISNEMLNSALAVFFNDSTIETLEQRIRKLNPQWTQPVCVALKLNVLRRVLSYIGDVRKNHIFKRDMEDMDLEAISTGFSWIDDENKKRLIDLIVPTEVNAIETDYGKNVMSAVRQYFDSLKD